MAAVSEIMKLDADKLKEVQSAISLFHLLGLTDEDIALLPQVLKNWQLVVKNLNDMAVDLANLKQSTLAKKGRADTSLDTPENIRSLIGFEETTERVRFEEGGTKQ